MKTLFITDDGRSFDDKAAAAAHEREMARHVPVPLPVLREALRQATPYMVSAKDRRALAEQLQPLVDGADDYAKRQDENEAEFARVLDALNELAPMADSNDMNWTEEAMCRIDCIREKLNGAPPLTARELDAALDDAGTTVAPKI